MRDYLSRHEFGKGHGFRRRNAGEISRILAVFSTLFLLHVHAWRRRRELELTPAELSVTRETMQEHGSQMLIALISVGFALGGHARYAGVTYFLVGPVITINNTIMGRKQRKLFGR